VTSGLRLAIDDGQKCAHGTVGVANEMTECSLCLRGGWTVGVGGEYAFTDWLTGFAEYDFYGFGTRTIGFPVGPIVANIDIKETKSVFKVGLNWKFGGGPVVARY
jgi:hypothetical protein